MSEVNNLAVYTVTQVNNYIKTLFDRARPLSSLVMKGEIANFKRHSSGHLYFTLKDEFSQMSAIMFAPSAARLKFKPCDGMRVVAEGSVSVYVKSGNYQITVKNMQPDGVGALFLAYEQLKQQLQKEGLFALSHKKTLPAVPERIGVITSPTGAAVRDIINITGRRWPQAKLFLYPSKVQGEDAEEELIGGLTYFETKQKVDVIIIGRGGGSAEDLWAFNGERLARAIYAANTPIVSAVGHETDFTICDFVADKRAPTPSAAAELVVPDRKEMQRRVESLHKLIGQNVVMLVQKKKRDCIERERALQKEISRCLEAKRYALQLAAGKLKALNPLAVLARGYSITEKEGKAVCCADELKEGDALLLRFQKGRALTIVKKIEET